MVGICICATTTIPSAATGEDLSYKTMCTLVHRIPDQVNAGCRELAFLPWHLQHFENFENLRLCHSMAWRVR